MRINPAHPETPADLADRALPVPADAQHLLGMAGSQRQCEPAVRRSMY
ncbi:hypothetical protein SAZ11_16735 [Streptomyces sp. FXJ1.4098]|nr:hypothetical protein [Streptomyces sp. FXJ1.4098]